MIVGCEPFIDNWLEINKFRIKDDFSGLFGSLINCLGVGLIFLEPFPTDECSTA